MIKYSFLTSFYSRRAQRYIPSPYLQNITADDWTHFTAHLYEMQQHVHNSKEVAPLISPAFYNEEAYRSNSNVSGWSFLALDFDGGLDFDDAVAWFEALGLSYVLYTTASSRPDHHKFRAFIPFSRDVEPNEMDKVWQGGFEYFGRLTDPSCKDKSRAYYVPGKYPDAYTDFAGNHADAISPELLKRYAPADPPETKQKVNFIDSGKEIVWTSLNDCPFVKERWINDYLSLPNGQDQHYQGLYKFMVRVAGLAKNRGYGMPAHKLAELAREVDLRKDKRWHKQGRSWEREAENAINYIYGRA